MDSHDPGPTNRGALLDEPTTHLDMAHAVEVLELVTRLRDKTGRTILTVLHDPRSRPATVITLLS